MQTTDDMQFRDAELKCLARFRKHFDQIVFVGTGIAPPAVKRAEIAIEDAKIRIVDVPVENVIRSVRILPFAYQIRHRTNCRQVIRRKQPPALGFINPPASFHFLVNIA